ncbi:hypothetical protein [Actinoplanes couchii]|uniref:HNH endonuclease n=1 Tax=Actinoplanes couchii TaxID=403638 RepID=A0ABQ3X6I3_9ACTN|nr:hypothetical protein [Actinoplanes couchii]MDR6325281.1 hypothetical protein [Actinoplanes couchii]GID54015.1 hypothetical protein Aco03nite_024190 [Actinoplanes couchii]
MSSNLLAELIDARRRPPMPFLPPARPPLQIRRRLSDEGAPFWRWDCTGCGEYGGGRHHEDAMNRALRHCHEHPVHRSSLLPPAHCREPHTYLPLHPMLYAIDDDPPPEPLRL